VDQGIGAWRSAAISRARLERHIKRRAFRIMPALPRVVESLDFSVWFSRAPMPAAANDFAILDEDRADHWIGRRVAIGSPRQTQRHSHRILISARISQTAPQRTALGQTAASLQPVRPGRRILSA